MKLEDIVVSLEVAKALKAAGYSQESLFYLEKDLDDTELGGDRWELRLKEDCIWFGTEHNVAAPTASEIGEKLPRTIMDGEQYAFVQTPIMGKELGWVVEYFDFYNKNRLHREFGDTEANARAKMWLYLKENNLIK